jgi:Reverse transcriptase (RNA-dependent DNA polymerase)
MSYMNNVNVAGLTDLKFEHVGPSYFCDIVNSFEPKNSIDMEGISMKLLKFVNTAVSIPLSHIFNLSLQQGVFPEALKISRVVPIFKGGDPDLCDNYRPISLVNTIAKVLEKIVSIKLTNHLETHNIIDPLQFGFQRGLSTEHSLLHLTKFVGDAMNDNKFSIGVFLDLKKAFDVVSHEILLKKLSYYGIKNNVLSWFASYLNNRKQCVDINGNFSKPRHINISVMQGSVLGPILFLIFINDLTKATTLKTLLFADDACSLHADKNLKNLIVKVNTELQKIANWFSANKLVVNVKKCKYIIFHTKGKKLDFEGQEVFLNLNDRNGTQHEEKIIKLDRISNSSSEKYYKYLGILIDENLNFNAHTDYLCNKLSKALYCLRRAKSFVTKNALVLLFHALFNAHLWYCTNIISITSQSNINRIQILQKKAIRLVTNSDYNAHTAELFTNLKVLPFEKLIKYKQLLFMHSIKYKLAPSSFNNMWLVNNEIERNYNLRLNDDFVLPYPRFEGFRKFPSYSFAKCWNEADEIRLQRNPLTFKIELKKQLLNIPPPPPVFRFLDFLDL